MAHSAAYHQRRGRTPFDGPLARATYWPRRLDGRRVARGLTWTLAQTWGGQTLSLIVFVILARLLTPDDFGLVALAGVFVSLAQLVVDQGLGDALVQRRRSPAPMSIPHSGWRSSAGLGSR